VYYLKIVNFSLWHLWRESKKVQIKFVSFSLWHLGEKVKKFKSNFGFPLWHLWRESKKVQIKFWFSLFGILERK